MLFILDGRWMKTLNPKQQAPLWNVTKFHIGGSRLVLWLVLILWVSSFDLYWSHIRHTNNIPSQAKCRCNKGRKNKKRQRQCEISSLALTIVKVCQPRIKTNIECESRYWQQEANYVIYAKYRSCCLNMTFVGHVVADFFSPDSNRFTRKLYHNTFRHF